MSFSRGIRRCATAQRSVPAQSDMRAKLSANLKSIALSLDSVALMSDCADEQVYLGIHGSQFACDKCRLK